MQYIILLLNFVYLLIVTRLILFFAIALPTFSSSSICVGDYTLSHRASPIVTHVLMLFQRKIFLCLLVLGRELFLLWAFEAH